MAFDLETNAAFRKRGRLCHTRPMSQPDEKSRPATRVVKRHALLVRLTHWINVVALTIMLLSGLQIFNAHPALYWGKKATFDSPWLSMTAQGDRGVTYFLGKTFDTTGVLGLSEHDGQKVVQGFPAWTTIPHLRDLASGRNWHLFFAWVFGINGLIYLLSGLISRHLQRDVLPSPKDIKALPRDPHLRFKFSKGPDSLRYHPMQRLAYSGMVVIVLPLVILTGLTMSPSMNAAFPGLLDLFGGRQSARSIHFICAVLIVLFVIVHVLMVIASGPFNQLRGMITGKVSVREDQP